MNCQNCDKTLSAAQKKFCCKPCHGSFRSQANRVERECRLCKKKFSVKKTETRSLSRKYCSTQCWYEYQRHNPVAQCSKCGVAKNPETFRTLANGRLASYCNDCEKSHHHDHHRKPRGRWCDGRSKAKTHGVEWSLSLDEFTSLISLPCHYCGGPLNPTNIGLDRKSPKGGYTPDNVVPCCARCNRVKLDHFTYEEMLVLAETIKHIDRERGHNP